MKLRSALLAATVLAAPVAARAEAISGIYVGAGAGANFLQPQRESTTVPGSAFGFGGTYNPITNASTTGNSSVRFDTGYRLLGSVGYGFGNGLRVEIEGDYFQNHLSEVRGGFRSPLSTNAFQRSFASAGGDEQKYGGFVNVLYDFDPNVLGFANVFGYLPFPVSPYVGVGAGYLQTTYHNVRVYPSNSRQYLLRSTGTDGDFAYQGIFGVAVPISSVPGLALTAEYRFTGTGSTSDRHLKGQYFAGNTIRGATINADDDDFNHSIMVGFRYAFNAAPPPPPPVAPAPVQQQASARTYLVFFDWDRADLTDRARQIIAQAAQATTRVAVTRIEVNGYTDSSGTARYNLGLSQRRAQSVAAELVRDGVSRSAITIQGFGETRPLVPTADGVREPQNRRVEIILR